MAEVTYQRGIYNNGDSEILYVRELVDRTVSRAISYHPTRKEVMIHRPAGEFRDADICVFLGYSCSHDVLLPGKNDSVSSKETNNGIFKALEVILRS